MILGERYHPAYGDLITVVSDLSGEFYSAFSGLSFHSSRLIAAQTDSKLY